MQRLFLRQGGRVTLGRLKGSTKLRGAADLNNSQNLIRRFEVNSKTPDTYMFEQKKNIQNYYKSGVEGLK